MPGVRITLMNRIVTLMILFTIFFVASFTAIQVNSQLHLLTRHNIYRSKVGSITAKNALEKISQEAQQPHEIINAAQAEMGKLYESGILDSAQIISESGQIVAATNRYMIGKKAAAKDKNVFKVFSGQTVKTKSFYSSVDKKRRLLNQYMPISYNLQTPFIAKISYSLGNIRDALRQVYVPCLLTVFLLIGGNFFFGFMLSKAIIGPIRVLNEATKKIAGGHLELRVNMHTRDELKELADTFNEMTKSLIEMHDRAENANPLTKLSGNNVIHEEIEKRIKNNMHFVAVYTDLDNFKAFNDKYGIGRGDKAIKLTADILQESLKKHDPQGFLGHEGGDDFVLLTTPEKAKPVSDRIISEFDKKIRSLYSKEDLEKGHITAEARDGSKQEFPVMTISLAAVSNTEKPLTSYAEVTNICAGVKKKAKAIAGSAFVLDKRHV